MKVFVKLSLAALALPVLAQGHVHQNNAMPPIEAEHLAVPATMKVN